MIQKSKVEVGFPRTRHVLGAFTAVVVPFGAGIPAVKGVLVVMAIVSLLLMASRPFFSERTL